MILAITDGVGLTNELARARLDASKTLHRFFELQIAAFKCFECMHERIVKTTGDGLIFAVSDEGDCGTECGDNPRNRMLKAISKAMEFTLEQPGIGLRTVLHWSNESKVEKGTKVVPCDNPAIEDSKMIVGTKGTVETLHSDI